MYKPVTPAQHHYQIPTKANWIEKLGSDLIEKWDPVLDNDLINDNENKRHFAYWLRNTGALHSSLLLWRFFTGAQSSNTQNKLVSSIKNQVSANYEKVSDYAEQTAESNEGE